MARRSYLVSQCQYDVAFPVFATYVQLELLPDWPGAYSTLAVLYLDTGQVAKARRVFERYQEVFPQGPLDTKEIDRQLAAAEEKPPAQQTITPQMQSQFLQMALTLAGTVPQ